MAFLPFNIPKQKRLKVVIVGGGYAGVAALTNLLHYAPDTDITIIDPKTQHIKITHLHETFRYPLTDLLVPFTEIENRYECRHIVASVNFDQDKLQECQDKKQLVLNEEVLDFDYLIIASGCESRAVDPIRKDNILSLQDFTIANGSDLLTKLLDQGNSSEQSISVVGGGATGIQFLFEIKQFLNRIKSKAALRLIHSGEHVLEQFPDGFGSYVEARMGEMDIAFYPNTYYREQQDGQILLTNKQTKEPFELASSLSILFLGKKQQNIFTANAFGQGIIANQEPLQNIFVAGDCSYYQSLGSNTLTAQSAVRKGKLVARNILRHSGFPGLLEPYLHHELGYVVSLGPSDAVGWLVSEGNLITGIPALTIKELVEVQYDLLLAGIDTYLV
ncbi:MAG: FAD-dependent oxidoreductase [Nitrosomonas sp.]|uniref:NAD(P)/FAD-dependent oxidoreductase n=1 Tax=Nitrosomonas sp. TaxID=42353 RepID=UPI00273557E0|nr:FAD-dependent oxidoreductase [Nitrosomonas sp.]MDP1934244.1 FAD-dependent oxidoreductase [Nitrosomonas sp.]MDP3282142.1 FAD-dependent oxidoreductase [Nitrosomonas sp.]MDP3664571.1 FAD-dependent oxidoreductase [Nitrosomonas sp.]MDZ4105348.1 FAD-dependent oxidoreductase [Nitrosomonas sp.]